MFPEIIKSKHQVVCVGVLKDIVLLYVVTGNLVFSNLVPEDELDRWYYRCAAENVLAGLLAVGSYAQITVNKSEYLF